MSQSYSSNCFSTANVVQTDMQNIENNFDALRSCFSGSSAPTSPDAGQFWFDTGSSSLKIRYNSSWDEIWDFDNHAVASGAVKTNSIAAGALSTDSTGRAIMANGFIKSSHVEDVDVTKITNLNKAAVVLTGPKISVDTSDVHGGMYGYSNATANSTFTLGRTYLPNTGANKLKLSYETYAASGCNITIVCGTSAVLMASPGAGTVLGDGSTYIDVTSWLGSAQTIYLRFNSAVGGQMVTLNSFALYLTT